jgi:N-acetylmuramoyl-L-alanine amidase
MKQLADIILYLLRLLAQAFRTTRGQFVDAPQVEQVESDEDTTAPVTPTPTPEPEPEPAIVAHRLPGAKYYSTSNQSSHEIRPQYLIIHYTANSSVTGTVRHFQKEGSNASAHLIIGRDGELVQMVDFNRKAWHAGESRWGNVWALNEVSVGIELVNWGPLTPKGSKLMPWTRNPNDAVDGIDAGQFTRRSDGKLGWWQLYPDEQLEVCFNVSRELVRHYKMLDVLGHEDISPARKQDPGPAFPLRQLREFCFSDVDFHEFKKTWES